MRMLMAAGALVVMSLSTLGAAGGAITGYVSDAKCAASGAAKKTAAEWIKPAAFENCVKECVGQGSEAIFLTEDNKVLKFDAASKDKITPFLGHKVSVVGKIEGSTLTVSKISGLELK
jgi:hypothetical protein